MGFRLTPRSMTLDDLELHKFTFSVNFAGFRRFRTQQQLTKWRKASIVSDNVVSTSNWSNFWQAFASRGFVSDSWAFLLKYWWVNFVWSWRLVSFQITEYFHYVRRNEVNRVSHIHLYVRALKARVFTKSLYRLLKNWLSTPAFCSSVFVTFCHF